MKNYILIFSCFLLFVTKASAQSTDKINFQMILRDASGELLSNNAVGIKFQILETTATGSIIFEESHTTATNAMGLVSIKIGDGVILNGAINTIDWLDKPHYLKIQIDPTGGTNYSLQSIDKLGQAPIASSALKTANALSADYNSLTNAPITITSNQIELLGYLTLNTAIDLDAIKTAVDLNSNKNFPEFGTIEGTAYDILWSKIGNHAFFNHHVGIGTNTNLNTGAALLKVEGGILYESNTTIEPEIGALKYLNLESTTLNDFYFGNNSGEFELLGSATNTDIVFTTDVNILSKLGIGENINESYNFTNNNIVLASSTPSILFDDTSISASFPSTDWSIEINNDTNLNENYFSIENYTTGDSNFKIMAEAPDHAFKILENGNVGLNIENPTTKLEVENTVTATSFIGNASGLTNLPSTGTSSTINTGSTTLAADDDSNNNGSFYFNANTNTLMQINSAGAIAIGSHAPTASLDVDGNFITNNLSTENLLLHGHLKKNIIEETPSSFSSIDVSGKSYIIMKPTSTNYYFSVLNGIDGQIVTIINAGTGTLAFYPGSILTPGNTIISIAQNESITLVQKGGSYLIVNLVN